MAGQGFKPGLSGLKAIALHHVRLQLSPLATKTSPKALRQPGWVWLWGQLLPTCLSSSPRTPPLPHWEDLADGTSLFLPRMPFLLAACITGTSDTQGRVSNTGLVTAAALQGMSSPETKLRK